MNFQIPFGKDCTIRFLDDQPSWDYQWIEYDPETLKLRNSWRSRKPELPKRGDILFCEDNVVYVNF